MRRLRSACTMATGLILFTSACTEPEEPVVVPSEPTAKAASGAVASVAWTCESGDTVAVGYPEPGAAQLNYKGKAYPMRSAQSASGARYIGSGLEWSTATRDGLEQATLSRLGQDQEVAVALLETCSRPAAGPGIAGVLPPQPEIVPVSAPCKGPQLKLSLDGGDAGAGNRVSILGVENVGAQPCSLTGYPTISVQDAQARAITTVRAEQDPGNYFRAGQVPAPVEVAPRAKAYFDLAWNVVPNEAQGEKTCPSVTRIRMIAPADTAVVLLDQAFAPCGGRVRVSPFRPVAEPEAATSAAPAATPRPKT